MFCRRVSHSDARSRRFGKGEHGGEARLMLTTGGPAATEVWRWTLEPGEEYPSHPQLAPEHRRGHGALGGGTA
ncbi:hypothetical protein Shyd_94740 [Streptomyces hydrogenans]|uniref:Uncharacterized protein n=1 Tax=Streptomyces hydrogenans TaxID=1873719 RepID=A0ABQ3PSV4_9ACTN|nr:hypothetical protein GCM10018784_07180 [Streptomyces hydrogenans]GHI28103.1 hypothetical protein Shyd_94740 [Streptomyces hydrogenans]